MAKSIPALVKPELLVWAREAAKLSLAQAAQKTKFDDEILQKWEVGDERPSIAQLRKLGEAYKRPIAVFFLAEPPKDFAPQKEFRRLSGLPPGSESPEFVIALRHALLRREAALELYELVGEKPPKVALAFHPTDDAETVGERIRNALGVTWKMQLDGTSAHAALNVWRNGIEEAGALVFQASGVELKEMRGTCIPDEPLPLILINSKDAPHGRIFTALHEFVHIALRNAGYATSRMEGKRAPQEQQLEVAANSIAAAALLPKEPFLELEIKYPLAKEGDDSDLRKFAGRTKVSPETILRRLVTLDRATNGVYKAKRKEWGWRVWYVSQSGSGGGPPQHVRAIAANGRGFTDMVLNAYYQRKISASSASDILGVKPKHFSNIRRELSLGPEVAGAA